MVRLGDADHVSIVLDGEKLEATTHALPLLHAFAHPRKIADVLADSAAGPEHWMDLSSTIVQLARAGVLHTPGLDAAPRGFAQPAMHIVMLDDEARTRGYIGALQKVIKHGDVVVDVGTGTGVLAVSAVRAGAARVHAIESSAIADAADRVFAANEMTDHITLALRALARDRSPDRGARDVGAHRLGLRSRDDLALHKLKRREGRF